MEQKMVTIKLDIRDAHTLFTALLGVDANSMLHPTVRDVADKTTMQLIDRAIENLHLQLTYCVFQTQA